MDDYFKNEEQIAMRDSVRKLAQNEIPKYESNRASGTLPLPLFRSMSDAGLAGLVISEEYGGSGLGPLAAINTFEELARGDLGAAVFLSVHFMVSGIIQRHGSHALKSELLPKLATGKMLGAFALTEPTAGSDASRLRTSYHSQDGSFVLSGEKCYITSAGFADLYIVFARKAGSEGAQGISAFAVTIDNNNPPTGWVVSAPDKKMGAELSPIASISLNNLRVPVSALIGTEGEGYRIALSGLAGGRVNIAACANGLSAEALDLSLNHLENREQFGESLIEFQGLQFMLADMKIKFEAARLLTWRAAKELEANPQSKDSKVFPSMAKCFATDAAMSITTDAVQLLGGAGYIKDYKVERLMRDAKMLQIVEGTNQIQRLVITKEMRRIR